MKKIIFGCGLMALIVMAGCVVAPGPAYYPGPYVAQPVVYGGGYYYHHGYGYYR